MQNLGVLSGGMSTYANAANADGSVVVGWDESAGSDRAFLWNASVGMVDLNVFLPTLGVNLAGWNLQQARGISDDGSVIVGYGTYNGETRAWRVTGVPAPSAAVVVALGGLLTSRRRRTD
jgi:probable HAF family extracellular repeat protein